MSRFKHCAVCGKIYSTGPEQEEVWIEDAGRLICKDCYIRVMDKLCEQMEEKERGKKKNKLN